MQTQTESLVSHIADKADRELCTGALLCTVTKPLDVASNGSRGRFELAHKVKLTFSWGEETVFIYRANVRKDKAKDLDQARVRQRGKMHQKGLFNKTGGDALRAAPTPVFAGPFAACCPDSSNS